jgi:acetoin utilization deacetylase AcuC-like enzyme/GNAT superfamily N-acetyltransferase
MIRIRRIYDDVNDQDKAAILQAQEILRQQFPGISEETIQGLPDELRDPLRRRFRTILFVAEDIRHKVRGFALLHHFPDLRFCHLGFISAAKGRTGGGIGGALYERVREEARALGAIGLFFECLPDDPSLCRDPEQLKENAKRLRFYEQYGACPVINTKYETPLEAGEDSPPYLVFDDLGQHRPLKRDEAQKIVAALLERRYGDLCPPEYIQLVVESFQEDPVQLRPRHHKSAAPPVKIAPNETKIVLVVNETHEVHHVREDGYVEAPVRINVIMRELQRVELFEQLAPRDFPEQNITAVHDEDFVRYLKRVCFEIKEGDSVYPYIFPLRNMTRPPEDLALRAGYYCIDTFTPLHSNAYNAARGAVNCALTAAEKVLEGDWLAYALVRPPGHHAERRYFGGFCYFNSAAVAAHFLSRHGKVAVLDVDYHHGNGQQDIFYQRDDVFTVSIHADPRYAYPYFTGFPEEEGEGAGKGFNVNLSLPETITSDQYRGELRRAIRLIEDFKPRFLVVCLGFDTAKGDPTGTWSLNSDDFEKNGDLIGRMGLPTLVVQEGGYRTRWLGINARRFFVGLWAGAAKVRRAPPLPAPRPAPPAEPATADRPAA